MLSPDQDSRFHGKDGEGHPLTLEANALIGSAHALVFPREGVLFSFF